MIQTCQLSCSLFQKERKLTLISSASREVSAAKDDAKGSNGFVMHVSDDEMDDIDSDVFRKESNWLGRHSTCNGLYLSGSKDSEDESTQLSLMVRVGFVERALIQLNQDHQLSDKVQIRNHTCVIAANLVTENEKNTSTHYQLEKSIKAQRELERKYTTQHQRKIAEERENYLAALQLDQKTKSLIEERKIRDDAAFEEANRKETALREEKLWQEKIKVEIEARLQAAMKRDEEAKAAALEAEKAAKQAVEVVANGALKQVAITRTTGLKKEQSPGNALVGAEKALKMEEKRFQIYKGLSSRNEFFELGNKEYRKKGNDIARLIKTINATKENIRAKAEELINIFNSSCTQSVSLVMFAKKVISHCVNTIGSFNSIIYPLCHVIVMVTSQVPLAMEILLAELNRVCIFTVPKYLICSESKFGSEEEYNRAIGYEEEVDGNLESSNSYVARLSSCMRLYGALVQTEVDGFKNLHGIKEGWTWLARFLNTLPANYHTAVALQAFLEMSGFGLHKRYKVQFKKLLDVIYGKFLNELKCKDDPRLSKAVMSLKTYIEMEQYLKEPVGRQLLSSLVSWECDFGL